MTSDEEPGHGRRLARAHVGDPVDLGEAVAAIAGETERAAAGRMRAGPQDGQRDRVARLERSRLVVDDDPGAIESRRHRALGHGRIRNPSRVSGALLFAALIDAS